MRMQPHKQHAVLAMQQHATCTTATSQVAHCREPITHSIVTMGHTCHLHQGVAIREVGANLWQGGISKGGVQQHDSSTDTAQGLDVGQP